MDTVIVAYQVKLLKNHSDLTVKYRLFRISNIIDVKIQYHWNNPYSHVDQDNLVLLANMLNSLFHTGPVPG